MGVSSANDSSYRFGRRRGPLAFWCLTALLGALLSYAAWVLVKGAWQQPVDLGVAWLATVFAASAVALDLTVAWRAPGLVRRLLAGSPVIEIGPAGIRDRMHGDAIIPWISVTGARLVWRDRGPSIIAELLRDFGFTWALELIGVADSTLPREPDGVALTIMRRGNREPGMTTAAGEKGPVPLAAAEIMLPSTAPEVSDVPAAFVATLLARRGIPVRGIPRDFEPWPHDLLHRAPRDVAELMRGFLGDAAAATAQRLYAKAKDEGDSLRIARWQSVMPLLADPPPRDA